ncbi:hypothetical protein [Hyphococcus sp.]|uniref:hypothetical protein n=1 Tax=Hyphococcus sp. TaxID=2038636 RepID=UPI00207F79D2|nr:MAG: hypothetical protein DHS20C04_27560 [Marinicaulis sp.]
MNRRVRAGIMGAAVMFAMAAALKDNAVAFALGVAALVAFGGLSSGRCGDKD